MTAAQLGEIHTELARQRQELLTSVAGLDGDDATLAASQLSGEARPRSDADGDLIAVERHTLARLSANARTALSEIDGALARLANGSYGRCSGCQGEIAPERLLARPRAINCVRCASRR